MDARKLEIEILYLLFAYSPSEIASKWNKSNSFFPKGCEIIFGVFGALYLVSKRPNNCLKVTEVSPEVVEVNPEPERTATELAS